MVKTLSVMVLIVMTLLADGKKSVIPVRLEACHAVVILAMRVIMGNEKP